MHHQMQAEQQVGSEPQDQLLLGHFEAWMANYPEYFAVAEWSD